MRITGRHHTVTERQRDYIEAKIKRLEKHVTQVDEVQFILGEEKHDNICEINFRAGAIKAFTKDSDKLDMLAAIDKAVDKMEMQITRAKERRYGSKKHAGKPHLFGMDLEPETADG